MNRRTRATLVVLSIALASCSGQSGGHGHSTAGAVPPPMVYEGLGSYHQDITASDAAQAYFDQGLRLVYAFNHLEAESAFREATRLDPTCAMCYWGIALSQGSNYNSPTDAERERTAFVAVQQAVVLGGGKAALPGDPLAEGQEAAQGGPEGGQGLVLRRRHALPGRRPSGHVPHIYRATIRPCNTAHRPIPCATSPPAGACCR